jgi:hypothetical protein
VTEVRQCNDDGRIQTCAADRRTDRPSGVRAAELSRHPRASCTGGCARSPAEARAIASGVVCPSKTDRGATFVTPRRLRRRVLHSPARYEAGEPFPRIGALLGRRAGETRSRRRRASAGLTKPRPARGASLPGQRVSNPSLTHRNRDVLAQADCRSERGFGVRRRESPQKPTKPDVGNRKGRVHFRERGGTRGCDAAGRPTRSTSRPARCLTSSCR